MKNKKIRVLFAGGGTGGHIFPLAAIAQAVRKISPSETELFYLGPEHELNNEFEKLDVKIYKLTSSKIRRYFDLRNFLDIPKFFWSLVQALAKVYAIMPDVVLSKGGPGALPVVLAAAFYFVPVIIHDSDSVPGLANRVSGRFAKRILISFKKAARFFPTSKIIFSGNPIRFELLEGWVEREKAKEVLGFNPKEPVVLVLGGSQGAQRINNVIFENLEAFCGVAQIYHQVGIGNFVEAQKNLPVSQPRYRNTANFDAQGMKYALNAADAVISRAGAGAIFEIAAFGKPSILIPLDGAANDHQKSNAYEYAENGSAIVIEEANFKINIVLVQIKKILENQALAQKMSEAAKNFAQVNAAEIIAKEIFLFVQK